MKTSLLTKQPHWLYIGILFLLTLLMCLPGQTEIPVIDRDEARYAQATVQMVESGDYVNIRFQDAPRHKKPVGIYWMQAGFVKALTDPGERQIWVHRLPSVIGAILAVLALYWGTVKTLGRQTAFIGAALLATSTLFVFESHIAKTDMMLCAMATLILSIFMIVRQTSQHPKLYAILFWGALGLSVLIKGPIIPLLIALTLITLLLWEREGQWIKNLISFPGILLFLLIVLPWTALIFLSTDGAFFTDAITQDLTPKLMGGQEKHGAPPGYYITSLPLLFWPASLFIIPGLIFALKGAFYRPNKDKDQNADTSQMAHIMRLLIAWSVPFWIFLEIAPTKLPHYLLPAYPALALMCACTIKTLISFDVFKTSRKISALLFLIATIILLIVVFAAEAQFAVKQSTSLLFIPLCVVFAFWAFIALWNGRVERAFIAAILSACLLNPLTYQFIMPRLETLYVSHKIEAAYHDQGWALPRYGGGTLLATNFTEPSLVYRLGTQIVLGDKAQFYISMPESPEMDHLSSLSIGDVILFDIGSETGPSNVRTFRALAHKSQMCFLEAPPVKGFNYSKGRHVNIALFSITACEDRPKE